MNILYIVITLAVMFVISTLSISLASKKKKFKEPKAFVCNVIDEDKIARNLSDAIKIETISMVGDDSDGSAFLQFHKFLEERFPLIHKRATKTLINHYSLVYCIEGSDKSLLPACFLAHQDVVPADATEWEYPPFEGVIVDGFIYGRGSQDMKNQMIAVLSAIEYTLSIGEEIKRGIYCCFGHDEEICGYKGAAKIVEYLSSKGVQFEYVIDEGGAVIDGSLLGINGDLALIGTCEKGQVDIVLTVESDGGHASSPNKRTALGMLGEAIYKVEKHPMKAKWTQPSKDMFNQLAPNMKPVFRYMFANRQTYSFLIKKVLMSGKMTAALMHTTFAPTMAEGSSRPNVMASKVSANINCRIVTGQTSEEVRQYIQSIVGKGVQVAISGVASEPTLVSPVDSKSFQTLISTIRELYPTFYPAPFLFIAATDARYYYSLSKNVYRFSPFKYSEDDSKRIHAKNERCTTKDLKLAGDFFVRLIQNTCL